MIADDSFTLTQYNTRHEPVLSDFEYSGRVRLTASCACRSRLHTLSSGQAKMCEHCGLMLARVGDRIHVARVMVGDGLE